MTIDAKWLVKSYGHNRVLDAVTLAVGPGEIHGLLGPNGSGKTTCLHILTGLIAADEGSACIEGINVARKESRHLFGFAPDDLPLPGALTGREFLRFHDALRGRDDSARANQFAELLGIDGALDQPVAEYSHGMQRKLQVIGAVMHDPELLILDEPFRGLDPEAAATLRAMIIAFAESGRAVLIATHDMLRAERDCDAVTILSSGRIVAVGAPQQLIEDQPAASSLEDVFMHVTGRVDDATRKLRFMETAFQR
ncbi:ABC transporter ATP-binding protein [uncultured Leifsonia sp.]|uniref:ABC transporter ATP-binding protein n=1 Tax=uncultured Leifsonia sp. TaxID=340359 RepID=UPI0025EF824C|nr:ABC transporter ATP-binding protein [uncultured Leifsonia sp.]